MGERGALMLTDLFAMDGYGWFVWSAYGITLLVFAVNLFLPWREKRRVKHALQQLLAQHSQ